MISAWTYKNKVFAFITEERLSEMVDLLHAPEVERYLWFAPITLEGFRTYTMPLIQQQKDAFSDGRYPASATFTVTEDDELLGCCGIDRLADGHNVARVGYQLKCAAWGRGVATCCLEFLLHYAKSYLDVRKLFADCVAENQASIRVMRKCGFTFEGTIKEKYELHGQLHDNAWYGLRMSEVVPLPEGAVEEIG